jgi:hypothetical protein
LPSERLMHSVGNMKTEHFEYNHISAEFCSAHGYGIRQFCRAHE